MRKALFTLVLISSLFLSACTRQASMEGKPFEGTITQVIKMPGLAKLIMAGRDSLHQNSQETPGLGMLGALANMSVKSYIKADKIAYEMSMAGGLMNARAIIDRSSRTITMLTPMKKAMVVNLRELDKMRAKMDDSIRSHPERLDSLLNSAPQPTGKKSVIKGFDVEEYVGRSRGMDVRIWMTDDPRMKYFEVIRDAILGRAQTGAGGIEEAFSMIGMTANGKVPVKAEVTMNGETIVTSELTEIDEGAVDESMFKIPADYEIVKSDSARKE